MKQRILIFYDHFYPSYKAGGPTQSLVNLVRELHDAYEVFVVCKPHERGETTLLQGIKANEWTAWENKAKIYYWQYGWSARVELLKLIKEVSPDVVYINGIYSLYFNFLPLWYAVKYKAKKASLKIVLAARGMLHGGALSQKSIKKKPFLFLFKLLGLHQQVCWHATDEREAAFIQSAMGSNVQVKTAANFPNLLPVIGGPGKAENELVLGTVALISPMKNHLAVLQALQKSTATVTWFIFGPVKDAAYWNECKALIDLLPSTIKVKYKGELPPTQLQEAMQQFQVFIMPSKSENFGHAIMEALSAGKPVITSTTTPFGDLEHANCGFAIEPGNLVEGLQKAITAFAAMNSQDFEVSAKATQSYLSAKTDAATLRAAYHSLFN
ncbi:glycosyltransferase [Lacibacter luteus]|uniref:Glycosyltransferase n=1 Tax=Lacibacter luteus TaxID=2508719 RepID=A0A4Q1CH44_9BACT|nr:glycosyltransferase family 4 protein [Lacibacter luteus]RXK59442.1 glycosyltransferase [Lacibacter luteus]